MLQRRWQLYEDWEGLSFKIRKEDGGETLPAVLILSVKTQYAQTNSRRKYVCL